MINTKILIYTLSDKYIIFIHLQVTVLIATISMVAAQYGGYGGSGGYGGHGHEQIVKDYHVRISKDFFIISFSLVLFTDFVARDVGLSGQYLVQITDCKKIIINHNVVSVIIFIRKLYT